MCQNLRTTSRWPKFTGSYKKSVYFPYRRPSRLIKSLLRISLSWSSSRQYVFIFTIVLIRTKKHLFYLQQPGADVVGVNCFWGPDQLLETIEIMKKAMEDAGVKRHLIVQPIGYHTPERNHLGFTGIDEFPFGKYYYQ